MPLEDRTQAHHLAAGSDASRPRKSSKATPGSSISSSATSIAHSLAQVLRLGVFESLSTRDAMAVLSCCKTFWNDAELAKLALFDGVTASNTEHCFQGCGPD